MTEDERRDDLAAAYLDGECTARERAQVEADTDLLARVERQRRVRAALVEPVSIDGSRREAALAAALAVYDELHLASPAVTAPAPSAPTARAPVTSLADRRRLSRYNGRRLVIGTGIAAAALAAVGIAGRVDLGGGSGDDDTATGDFAEDATTDAASALAIEEAPGDGGAAATETTSAAGAFDEADAAMAAESGSASAETTIVAADDDAAESTAGARLEELGAFEDTASLSATLESILEGEPGVDTNPAATTQSETFGASTCVSGPEPSAGDEATFVASATLGDQPVLVVVSPTGTVRLLDPGTCGLVDSFELRG